MRLILTIIGLIIIAFTANAQAVLVQDINPGRDSSFPSDKYIFKDKLVFIAYTGQKREIWSFDGTKATKVFTQPGYNFPGYHLLKPMTIADGKLYFRSIDSNFTGWELWMWDGTNPVSLAADLTSNSQGSEPSDFVTIDNKVYFTASDDYVHYYVWEHNPKTKVTRKLPGTEPGVYKDAKYFWNLTVFNNKLYFGTVFNATGISELYVYDPATDKTQNAPGFIKSKNFNPTQIFECYGKLYFGANPGPEGQELYVYDGKTAPVRLSDIDTSSSYPNSLPVWQGSLGYCPNFITGYKGFVYFLATKYVPPYQLYKYDPNTPLSATNPSHVYDINKHLPPLPKQDVVTEFIEYNGKLYFTGDDGPHGVELWMYDGINNPSMVADINTGAGSSYPRYFKIYKDDLYFTAADKTTGWELYKIGKYPASVENVFKVNSVKAYPNPAKNQLQFAIDMKEAYVFTITLTDITGREVYNSGIQQYSVGKVNIAADVSALANGSYLYRITTSDRVVLASGKIVKE